MRTDDQCGHTNKGRVEIGTRFRQIGTGSRVTVVAATGRCWQRGALSRSGRSPILRKPEALVVFHRIVKRSKLPRVINLVQRPSPFLKMFDLARPKVNAAFALSIQRDTTQRGALWVTWRRCCRADGAQFIRVFAKSIVQQPMQRLQWPLLRAGARKTPSRPRPSGTFAAGRKVGGLHHRKPCGGATGDSWPHRPPVRKHLRRKHLDEPSRKAKAPLAEERSALTLKRETHDFHRPGR
jgi:hypothetical protein